MRITKAAEYAIRCVFYLSRIGTKDVVNRKQIAREMEIPEQFLGKIAQQLNRAGILEIIQGAKGGLRLSVNPETLNLFDVIEAVMGDIYLNDCLMPSNACFRNSTCAIHELWAKARDQFRNTLETATFAGLIERETCLLQQSGNITPSFEESNEKETKP
jgi:Rrf2 family protein